MLLLRDVVDQSGVSFGTSGARGLVSAMTPEVCSAYVHAFIGAVVPHADSIVLGHDLRPSSPAIAQACANALTLAGKSVVFVGTLPTPAIAYYASLLGQPAIVVTGSHIPFDRNGIKFYREDGEISKHDEAAMFDQQVPAHIDHQPLVALPEIDGDAGQAYLDRYISVFGERVLQGMRIALYEHSSVARDLMRELLASLGAEVISLGRTDTFVPIDTEAVRTEDIEQARAWSKEHGFDAILSTDGDADRPLIGDETGTWMRGDVVGVLCAQALGVRVIVTPVSSNTVVERCELFQQAVRTKIGSPYVIAAMQEQIRRVESGVVVAGYEANGGFLLGADASIGGKVLKALPTRDAVLPMLALLSAAARRGLKLSELAKALPRRFTASDRIQQVPAEVSRSLLLAYSGDLSLASKAMAPNSGGVIHTDLTDGLRLTFSNGDIVHLRPSGNAPELRCYAESDTEQAAQALCHTCLSRIMSEVSSAQLQTPGNRP